MAIDVRLQYNGGLLPITLLFSFKNYTVDPMLLRLGNPFKSHEDVVFAAYDHLSVLTFSPVWDAQKV